VNVTNTKRFIPPGCRQPQEEQCHGTESATHRRIRPRLKLIFGEDATVARMRFMSSVLTSAVPQGVSVFVRKPMIAAGRQGRSSTLPQPRHCTARLGLCIMWEQGRLAVTRPCAMILIAARCSNGQACGHAFVEARARSGSRRDRFAFRAGPCREPFRRLIAIVLRQRWLRRVGNAGSL
jgi:hypothetical protein